MAVITNVGNPSKGGLRSFDVRRDMSGVADLVELCFAETLDTDGQRYIKQMRSVARSSSFFSLASAAAEQTSLPINGYVWEEDGRVVGNLSLISFTLNSARCYLIANVAVHPAYRRQGIARALTSRALEHTRSRHARAAWLQVREDNDPAIRLYLSLGFEERFRRTTWHSYPPGANTFSAPFLPPLYPLVIRRGDVQHWPQVQAWLRSVYPPGVAWHLPMNWNSLQPGIWGGLYRIFSGVKARHWIAQSGEDILSAVAWQSLPLQSDTMWLGAPPDADGPAITALLRAARQNISPRRTLTLDFPAGQFVQDIRAAGFQSHHTLIWMEAQLP